MSYKPILGVIAGATRDHLLVEVVLHETLCDRYIKGRVIFEEKKGRGSSFLKVWEQSTRKCSRCAKKLKDWQAED